MKLRKPHLWIVKKTPTAWPPAEYCKPPNQVLVSTRSALGWGIKWATSSKWSHVEIFRKNGTMVGAVAGGMVVHDLEEVLSWGVSAIVGPPPLIYTDDALGAYCEYVEWLVDEKTGYDFASLPFWVFGLETSSRLNCSEAAMFCWDQLFRDNRQWPLQGQRLRMATPQDIAAIGYSLWASDGGKVRALNQRAQTKAHDWTDNLSRFKLEERR